MIFCGGFFYGFYPLSQQIGSSAYLFFRHEVETAEMLALQSCLPLVTPPLQERSGGGYIPFSKRNAQVLLVKDTNIWKLAKHLKKNYASTTLFRNTWRQLLSCLDFDPEDYSPYGVRRGGATWYFLETNSLDATVARGRWAVTKTERAYIDDGTLTLAQQHWTRRQKRNVKTWMRQNRTQWSHLARLRS